MSILSVIRGWTCQGCGINRNDVTEVWRDCQCKEPIERRNVEQSNEAYWSFKQSPKKEVECLNCSHKFEVTPVITYHDRLGKFTVCPECKGSFDID